MKKQKRYSNEFIYKEQLSYLGKFINRFALERNQATVYSRLTVAKFLIYSDGRREAGTLFFFGKSDREGEGMACNYRLRRNRKIMLGF